MLQFVNESVPVSVETHVGASWVDGKRVTVTAFFVMDNANVRSMIEFAMIPITQFANNTCFNRVFLPGSMTSIVAVVGDCCGR